MFSSDQPTHFFPQIYIDVPISVLCSICTVISSGAGWPAALSGVWALQKALLSSPHLFCLPLGPELHPWVNSLLKWRCLSVCPICLTETACFLMSADFLPVRSGHAVRPAPAGPRKVTQVVSLTGKQCFQCFRQRLLHQHFYEIYSAF